LYVGPKAVKGVKNTPKTIVNTAAKAGNKTAKKAVVARELSKGIKENTKNGRIEVTEDYFNAPDKWYRITETPEKYGIME
jgi:sarcosine oxidase gamma subunit